MFLKHFGHIIGIIAFVMFFISFDLITPDPSGYIEINHFHYSIASNGFIIGIQNFFMFIGGLGSLPIYKLINEIEITKIKMK